jgi:hypothetical protein
MSDSMSTDTPFAWFWYDQSNERYEFSLRREDAPSHAFPVYRKP